MVFIISLAISMLLVRLTIYFGLKNYRAIGRNYRRVIIVGYDSNSKSLYRFFKKSPEYGYKFYGFFSDKEENQNISRGSINSIKDFVLEKEIDEIYCTISELGTDIIKELIDFADNNLKVIKFIPDNKGLFNGRELKLQYYDFMPIFTLRENPFEDSINKWMKRIFDIVFSSFVIVFVLSWVIPILGILIKRESKGPIFFKQKRSGLDNKEFGVYKFRSMSVNKDSDKLQATKNDSRVTKIGAFLRSSSIDELPQFINVFKGEMSVVGPRPHMLSHTDYYSKVIDKFLVRHMVKPGITGLAQIRGFRGETEIVSQMKARARVDRFYIENWSMLLDIKIIIKTVINAIKGEKEAY
jgi:putative colanic acid biosynthesis UDP-glucose lipid carrier transferase